VKTGSIISGTGEQLRGFLQWKNKCGRPESGEAAEEGLRVEGAAES
jgi:hypothetical protein